MGDEMGFQHRDDEGSGTNTNPNAFYACGWDPLSQNQGFGAYPGVLQNQGMSSTSHLLSDSSFGEMAPRLVSLGSGGFSEMVGSFGLPDKEANGVEEGDMAASTDGKPISPFNKDGSLERSQVAREEEQSIGANLCGKQTKDNSNGAKKDDYIHVRARKGQATNSHSLAERVRREKISERMRLLQDIVPGCNKITGKAVMLDEIINYVQSLQQQVEFLSMKLATVNPELNIDIKRVLSKDVLHSHSGFGPAQPFPHGMFYGALPSISNVTQHFPPLPETVLDPELQNLFQMRYDLSFGPNGN